jgi:hypothetical protein
LRNLLAGILLFLIGQSLVWFQTNSQFFSTWAKNHPWIISITGGTIISFTFIHATNFLAKYYNGELWPGRFIGFATGMIAFSTLTYMIMNENINAKTFVCLGLACAIILIQLLWK